jgi:hypothetical protein
MSDDESVPRPVPKYCLPHRDLEDWAHIHSNARADRADAAFHLVRLVPAALQPEAMLWVMELERSATSAQGQLETLWSRSTQSAYLDGRATMAQETTRAMMGGESELTATRPH